MTAFLSLLLSMSYQAGIAVCVILTARFLFSLIKVPKKYSYALWAIPFLRLICPWAVKSSFSFLPDQAGSASAVQQNIQSSFSSLQVPGDLTATQLVPGTSFAAVDMAVAAKTAAAPLPEGGFLSVSPLMIVEIIWLTGILALCLYSTLTSFRLKLRLACSIKLQDHIYLADHIDTPFVLGVIHPCIYLPSSIQNHQMQYAIAHEQIHIRRKDHLIKSLAFAITCLHWFNPLVWIAFIFMNRDMEMSCDEAVLKNMGEGCRQEYATALLEMTAGRKMLSGIWLAFGKGSTKERIVNIMNYKKPLTFVIILAMIAMIALAAGLLTNPKSDNTSGSGNLQSQESDNQDMNYQKLLNQETENQADSPDVEIIPIRQPVIYSDTSLGADGAELHYADDNLIIFHGYFGLFVYSIPDRAYIGCVDLKSIGCSATQGDEYCEVFVKEDGSEVYLHPVNLDDMYVYDVKANQLTKQPFNIDGIPMADPPSEGRIPWSSDGTLDKLYYVDRNNTIKLFDKLKKAPEKSQQNTGTDEPDNLLYSGRYGMEVKESSLNPTGAVVLIHNNSDEVIEYGDDFHLCQLHEESNVWQDTPYAIENWAFHDIAYTIEPGQTAEVKIDWEWIYGPLPAGTYLLTKTISIPNQDGTWDSIELGVHFTLE